MVHLKLESFLKNFQLDLTLYKGQYEQLRTLLMNSNECDTQASLLAKDLLLLSSYYFSQNYSVITFFIRFKTIFIFYFFLHYKNLIAANNRYNIESYLIASRIEF